MNRTSILIAISLFLGTVSLEANLNEQIQLHQLSTYNMPPDSQDMTAMPKDTFARTKTTYVYGLFEVKNLLFQKEAKEYKQVFKFFQEGNILMGEVPTDFKVEKDWEFAWNYNGWGWQTPGHWPVGTHRIEVWIDGQKFAEKSFTITND